MKESAVPRDCCVDQIYLNMNFMMTIDSTQASPIDSQSDLMSNVIDE